MRDPKLAHILVISYILLSLAGKKAGNLSYFKVSLGETSHLRTRRALSKALASLSSPFS